MGGKAKRKSLRQMVFTWFFVFTLLPLVGLAIVVQQQYQKSVNQQIKDRLGITVRELESSFSRERSQLESFINRALLDKSVIYYLSTVDPSALKATLDPALKSFAMAKVQVYTHGGQLFINYRDGYKSVHNEPDLPVDLRVSLESKTVAHQVLFEEGAAGEIALSLSVVRKIVGVQERTVGYIRATQSVNRKYLNKLSQSLGADLVFFDSQGRITLSSLNNITELPDLSDDFLSGQNNFFEFNSVDTPYAFVSTPISWGELDFLMGIGSSKQEADANIRKVNIMVAMTFLGLFVFLGLVSIYFLREVIRPIELLIDASKHLKDAREAPFIPNHSKTEIADLVDSFNEMSLQIVESDQKMQNQLGLLEQANSKIKSTQTQLVQSAKLASLGELVAGIAHELNNPIGFIYSNIGHLKEYSESLFSIIDKSKKNKNELDLLVVEEDYDYIKKDLPKLIQSCEEGATRAKDIVLGLRSFSRVDEEKTQAFDVNSGLDSTLKLLAGSLRSTIIVRKDFNEVPKINCNINQMKQVFMNILNNAIQSIEGEGKIDIHTEFLSEDNHVVITISDSGVGIEKDNLEKIFDPFYTTKGVGEGTGLGLSITYGIIKSHGGQVSVSSEPGKGTSFRIELPIYRE